MRFLRTDTGYGLVDEQKRRNSRNLDITKEFQTSSLKKLYDFTVHAEWKRANTL
jgi:hypothetical protein